MDAGGQRSGFAGTQTGTHFRGDRPRASNYPAASDHAGKQRLPAFGGLVSEDNAANAIIAQDPASFGKSRSHFLLKPRTVLLAAIVAFDLILHSFLTLRCKWIGQIKWVDQQPMGRQTAFQPNQEKIGEISVRYSVIIWRV